MAMPNTESTDSYLTLSPLYFFVHMTSIHIRLGGLYCVCMWWIDYNCIDLDQLILRACTIPWALATSMPNPCNLLPPEGHWLCVLMANREPHMDMAETCLCKLYTQLLVLRLDMIQREKCTNVVRKQMRPHTSNRPCRSFAQLPWLWPVGLSGYEGHSF